jgi:hypothetical protein
LNKEQEEKVLETFKWKLAYQENLDSMFLQAYDCLLYAEELQNNYFSLSIKYDGLGSEYDKLEKDCTEKLVQQHEQILGLENNLFIEQSRKRTWRGVAIGEGVIITGIFLLILL